MLSRQLGTLASTLYQSFSTGKHAITALTRAEASALCQTVSSASSRLQGPGDAGYGSPRQEFLIITLSVTAPSDTHSKLVKATAAAGVPYVMPNCYGSDIRNPKLASEPFGAMVKAQIDEIESLGLLYVSLACGVSYAWSLALGDAFFGFEIKDRKVTVDDGKTTLNVGTWEMCGRAAAALLSLPEGGASPSLSDWKNEPVYVLSFRVS